MITYGSVCSGIEAATLAWEPLGWRAAWFAEIEKFPSAVLAHRWPQVVNMGNMTLLPDYLRNGWIAAPDVLVGGTPCQAFSVAGMRQGLVDPRGALTIKFVEVADAIDSQRPDDPCVVVWENVPGVLSDKSNAFGCFLAALVGEGVPLEPPGGKWSNAGCVLGPKRTAAWRVLDAQYFGVAQRRRRVFVVASARGGFDPCEVLFERQGVRRDTAPSREAGESITHPIAPSLTSSGRGVERGGDTRGQDPVVAVGHRMTAFGEYVDAVPSSTLKMRDYKDATDLVTHEHYLIRCDGCGYTFEGLLNQPCPYCRRICSGTADLITFNWNAQPDQMNFSSSSTPALTCSQGAAVCQAGPGPVSQYGDVAGSLTARHDSGPCADRGMNVVAFAENSRAEVRLEGGDGSRVGALSTGGGKAGQGVPCIAFKPGSSADARSIGAQEEIACTLESGGGGNNKQAVSYGLTVRRLMPIEGERLQGMPDNHTAIPGAADGPRYKAIGNSKAVPVVRWLGRRLQRELHHA